MFSEQDASAETRVRLSQEEVLGGKVEETLKLMEQDFPQAARVSQTAWNHSPFPNCRSYHSKQEVPTAPLCWECGRRRPQPSLGQSGESLLRGAFQTTNYTCYSWSLRPIYFQIEKSVQGCPLMSPSPMI